MSSTINCWLTGSTGSTGSTGGTTSLIVNREAKKAELVATVTDNELVAFAGLIKSMVRSTVIVPRVSLSSGFLRYLPLCDIHRFAH